MSSRFRWSDRLHCRREFDAVFREGRRVSESGLTVWVWRRPPGSVPEGPRLGMAIPKAFGNAVRRNRLKRLIRETFRLNKETVGGPVDMVFSSRKMELPLRLSALEPLIKSLWKKAGL